MFSAAAKDTSLKPLSLVFSCRLCYIGSGASVIQNFEFVLKDILDCVILILRLRMDIYNANVKIFCLKADGGWAFVNCSKSRDELSEITAHLKPHPNSCREAWPL